MGIFSVTQKGNFEKTDQFLSAMQKQVEFKDLDDLAQRGVDALAAATPVRSGLAASAWYYKIDIQNGSCSISWHNNDLDETGVPIVVLIQYGHATRNGGFVQGNDFINPAIQSIMQQISDNVWEVVRNS